jgi:predicted TPR repeat methyltransferase
MVSGGSLPAAYFEQMYSASADPWDFTGRWYEQRKRAVTIAALTRPRYRRAFEPGCSIGLLTEQLATRCDLLLASDVNQQAIDRAAQRLAGHPAVRLHRRQLPVDWPQGRFDLIVLSEIAYYFDESDATGIGQRCAESLTDDGTLVLCHWTHPVDDYPLSGELAQRLVREASGLDVAVRHEEGDFLLEVLHRPGQPSVAAAEGLVGVTSSRAGGSSPRGGGSS